MKKFIIHFVLLFGIFFLFTSCQKDIDKYSKISLSKWHPRFTLPVAKSTITFRDIIGNDSNIITNADSSLIYVYQQDSVLAFSIDSLLQFSPKKSEEYTFSLGAIHFNNFSTSSSISIKDILPYMNSQTADTLQNEDGNFNIFPPFHLAKTFVLKALPFDNFEQLTFSQGSLLISSTNELPVSLDTIYYDLVDKTTGKTIQSFHIYNFPPGKTQSETISLSGKTLSNQLMVVTHIFSSQGSYPDSVTINLSKGINFQFKTSNLQVISGTAILPKQLVFNKKEILDLSLENNEQLYNIFIDNGDLSYSVDSKLNTDIQANITFPSCQQNNGIPNKKILVKANSQAKEIWNLSGTEINLSTDQAHPYNKLPVRLSISLAPVNHLITFDSSNKVILRFYINRFTLESAEGYFGKQKYKLNDGGFSFNLNFLKNLEGSLAFTNPKIFFNYHNYLGIPIKAKIYLKAIKKDTKEVRNLNFDSVSFKYPKVRGQSVYGTVEINKNNSSISNFLSLLPDSLHYSGGFIINPNGLQTPTPNFISKKDNFSANVQIQIPFSFKTTGIKYTDTIKDIHINLDDLPSDTGTIYAAISNGLPFKVSINIAFPDSITGEILRSLNLGTIQSAKINNGTQNIPTKSKLKIIIPSGFLNDIQKANKIILYSMVSTFNQGKEPVQVHANDKITIYLGFSTTLNHKSF